MGYNGPLPQVVKAGGTGDASFTAFAPVCGGTTTTGALQSASTNIGTSGFVLTSTGAASLPTWQAVGIAGLTFAGDTGTATESGGTITFNANSNCGESVSFSASGATVSLLDTDAQSNIYIGSTAGHAIGGGNTHNNNVAIGVNAAHGVTTANSNVAIGNASFQSATQALNCVAVGKGSLSGINTGSSNTAIGFNAGSSYGTTESSNILLGCSVTGTLGESHVIRIGKTGSGTAQQNTCYIAGIKDATSVSSAVVVGLDTSDDQLLQTTITAGAGVTVTPGAGTITIAAPGAGFTWTDQSGTFTAAISNGYFITAASTPTLPASPSEGDTVAFVVDNASTCTITGNTGQKIRLGAALSAAAGTCANNARGDTIELVYRSSGTTWFATSSVGTWTIT